MIFIVSGMVLCCLVNDIAVREKVIFEYFFNFTILLIGLIYPVN